MTPDRSMLAASSPISLSLSLVWFECNTTNLGNKMRYKPTQNVGAHIQWVTTSAAKGRGSFRCHRFWWRTCSLVQSTEDWRPSHLSNRFPLALTLRLEASENVLRWAWNKKTWGQAIRSLRTHVNLHLVLLLGGHFFIWILFIIFGRVFFVSIDAFSCSLALGLRLGLGLGLGFALNSCLRLQWWLRWWLRLVFRQVRLFWCLAGFP